MPEKFIINGGKVLRGEIEARGAKNAAFPILAATLLTDESCTIDNIPLIKDVSNFIEILKTLGKKIEWLGERKLKIGGKLHKPVKGRTTKKDPAIGVLDNFRQALGLFLFCLEDLPQELVILFRFLEFPLAFLCQIGM